MGDPLQPISLRDEETERRLEKYLDTRPGMERVLSLLKAGLASAPFAGGIASLLTDAIPSARFRRLEEHAASIGEDLYRLQARVSEERLSSDHFAFMFEQSFKGAAEHHQREKRDAFRAMLVNAAIPGDLTEEEQEYFLGLVTRLSVLHLRILHFMARPEEYLATAAIPVDEIRGGFASMFARALPGISQDVTRPAFEDLYDAGLINTSSSIFGTMTSGQGLQLLRGRVSRLGEAFIEFCTLPG